jgi:hypothetical protein
VLPSDLDVAFERVALEELERTCGFDTDLADLTDRALFVRDWALGADFTEREDTRAAAGRLRLLLFVFCASAGVAIASAQTTLSVVTIMREACLNMCDLLNFCVVVAKRVR